MRYALIWSKEGKQEKAVLEKDEYFLGRLDRAYAEKVRKASPYRVYIFTPDMSEVSDTGIDSLVVSRRHAKLIVKTGGHREKGLYIIDHGSRGSGSKNGTLVNGEKIRPGTPMRLSPGDTIRLGTLGPIFTVGTHVSGKTVIRTMSGIPAQVPREVAAKLERMGVLADRRDVGDMSYVVFVSASDIDLGELVIKSMAPASRRVEFLRKVHVAVTALDQVEVALAEKNIEVALEELVPLQLEPMRNFIMGLNDPTIKSLYTEIFSLVKLSGLGIDTDALRVKVRKLRRALKALIDSV